MEAGPPSSRGTSTWKMPNTPPYYSARLRYEQNDWTMHASATMHELDVRGPPLLTGPLEKRRGWAASAGATIPFGFVAEDDELSFQATYAVDSSIFLGTSSDISFLAATIPTTGPVKGWSAVVSYLHNWNDDWSSNIFVSHLALDLDLTITRPSVRTTRFGANLVYQIDNHWQAGIEFGYIKAEIDINGVRGIINGASLSGQTGYLWLQYKL